jgi:hypothetical protein
MNILPERVKTADSLSPGDSDRGKGERRGVGNEAQITLQEHPEHTAIM